MKIETRNHFNTLSELDTASTLYTSSKQRP